MKYPEDLAMEAGATEEKLTRPALYIVGTPIGNLGDITIRALRVLRAVDRIACEDTRQTQKLLNHFQIRTSTISYHEHNELTRSAELVLDLEKGEAIALVTDAGMPGISDPGYRLISLAIRHHIPVVPIPGASAFLSALVASGLPGESFRFGGFLPPKTTARRQLLLKLKDSTRTQIFYESPHRIVETLKDIVDILGTSRHIVIAREVTKLYEEFLRASAGELLDLAQSRELLGEITLLIAKSEGSSAVPESATGSVKKRVQHVMQAEQVDEKTALKKVAKELGVSKSQAYRDLQRERTGI